MLRIHQKTVKARIAETVAAMDPSKAVASLPVLVPFKGAYSSSLHSPFLQTIGFGLLRAAFSAARSAPFSSVSGISEKSCLATKLDNALS